MASKTAVVRLQKEYKALIRSPVPNMIARPLPTNVLEWHYVLEGAKDTDYEGGVYHGKILFPPEYPFKPPGIMMVTPSGRFATNTRLCLSMSDFHPETWNPVWSVSSIMDGLASFMYDGTPTSGSVNTSKEEKRRLALQSAAWNLRNPVFVRVFPEYAAKLKDRVAAEAEARRAAATRRDGGGANGGEHHHADLASGHGEGREGAANGGERGDGGGGGSDADVRSRHAGEGGSMVSGVGKGGEELEDQVRSGWGRGGRGNLHEDQAGRRRQGGFLGNALSTLMMGAIMVCLLAVFALPLLDHRVTH